MREAVGPGLRSEGLRHVERDRKEDASCTRRVRRRHRRHHQIGQHDRVAQPQRTATQVPDDGVGQSFAEPGLDERTREQESRHDQPDGDVAVPGQRILDAEQLEDRARRRRDQDHRAGRNRTADQAARRSMRRDTANPTAAAKTPRGASTRSLPQPRAAPPIATVGRTSPKAPPELPRTSSSHSFGHGRPRELIPTGWASAIGRSSSPAGDARALLTVADRAHRLD